jgi:integrase/recombinase XerD
VLYYTTFGVIAERGTVSVRQDIVATSDDSQTIASGDNPQLDLADIAGFSAVSPEAALKRPLADLVRATLDAAGNSPHTYRAYQMALGLFVRFLDEQRGDRLPAEYARLWRPFTKVNKVGRRVEWEFRPPAAIVRAFVDPSILDGFRAWRLAEGDSPNTISARLAAIRTFLAICFRDGILAPDQARALDVTPYRVRQKRDRKPVGRRLTVEEAKSLRAAVDATTTKGKRDLAMLDFMLYLGLRRDEVATLDLSSFRIDRGRLWVHVTGKGNKTRRLKLPDGVKESLQGWLTAACLSLDDNGPCFRSVTRGDRVTTHAVDPGMIGRLVAEYGLAASIAPATGSNRLSPHDLRRTAARNAYDNGAPLLLVQAMLGHANLETTAYYIGVFDEDEKTAADYVQY